MLVILNLVGNKASLFKNLHFFTEWRQQGLIVHEASLAIKLLRNLHYMHLITQQQFVHYFDTCSRFDDSGILGSDNKSLRVSASVSGAA